MFVITPVQPMKSHGFVGVVDICHSTYKDCSRRPPWMVFCHFRWMNEGGVSWWMGLRPSSSAGMGQDEGLFLGGRTVHPGTSDGHLFNKF